MTLSELIKRVARSTGYEEDEIALILKHAISFIGSTLLSNEEVKLGGLGTFFWQHQKRTRRKHPRTGEEVEVPEQWKLKFRPVERLRFKEVSNGEVGSRDRPGEGEGG